MTIPQLLMALGYKWNKQAGRTTLEFELRNEHHQVIDKLLVFHPTKAYATVIHRGEKGVDMIRFVAENLHRFPQSAGCRNEVDGINRVLAHFANVEHDAGFQLADAMAKINNTLEVQEPQDYLAWDNSEVMEKKPFELARYERSPGDVEKAMGFLATRGITRETAELFRNTFEIIRDTQATKYKFRNLSFPYTKAGTPYNPEEPENICGYEVRGYGKFKNKASGTDSKFGCWQAYLGSDPLKARSAFGITQLHFAESALDIMASVQLNRNRLDLDRCLFISVGGTPSVEQLKGVTDTYTIAVPHLHFDNDENGIGYDCQMAAVLVGKSFSSSHSRDTENPRINFTLGEKAFSVDARSFSYNTFREASGLRNIDIKIEKAPNQYKDFNDIIMAQMKSEPNTELKQANARMAAVGRENAQGKTVQEKPATQAAEEDAPRRGRGL